MATNMFGTAPPPAGNPFGAQPSAAPVVNPFLAKPLGPPAASSAFGQPSGLGTAVGAPPAANPFQAATQAQANTTQRAASPFSFGQPSQVLTAPATAQTTQAPTFGSGPTLTAPSTAPAVPNPFQAAASPFGGASTTPAFGAKPLDALATAKAAAKKSVHFNSNPVSSTAPAYTSNGTAAPKPKAFARFTPKAPPPLVQQQTATQDEYTTKILAQLQKDRIKPPPWPADPGNPNKASAMDAFWQAYDDYRSKARDSLVKAGLIDNPNIRKKLNEAIDFKGICEDMCPEFEKIERIYQHNVMMAEKKEGPDGTQWPDPKIMVKALTRSSAGQEAPLPMDVRTVASLRRTLDYLIDNVLGDDSRLPVVHTFLWDRTRAIRRDFIFHSTMSEEEMQGQIYCLEVITRFHVTCLHLLSQKGLAPESFDQLQERVQLSKALLSLLQAYDDCKDRQIQCANEAEFRAYFILLNVQDPNFQHRVSEWGMSLWYDSDEVQTAMTLAQTIQSVWDWRGPGRPPIPTTTALGAFSTFFRIVESPQVSYTMACFAEAQFAHVRRGILRNTVRAYARTRDTPKDLTVKALNSMLRFDTLDEAWDFCTANGLAFSSDDKTTAYLDLSSRPTVSNEPLLQTFSQSLVERKRAGRSLPEALHTTVFEVPGTAPSVSAVSKSNDSELFVSQTPAPTPATVPSTGLPKAATPTISNMFGTGATKPAPTPTAAPAPAPAPAPSIFSVPSPAPAPTPSIFSAAPVKAEATPSILFPAADAKSTTPTTSPAKPAASIFGGAKTETGSMKPAATPFASNMFAPSPSTTSSNVFAHNPTTTSNMFTQNPTSTPATQQPLPSQPASSFASLFPSAPTATTVTPAATSVPAPAAASLFSAGSTTISKPATPTAPSFFPATAAAPNLFGAETTPAQLSDKAAGKRAETSAKSLFSASAQAPLAPAAPAAPAAPPPPSKSQLMDKFNTWLVLGDTGILDEFKAGFIEYLVRETFQQFQHDEAARIRREEDEASWAAATKFKTYNLRVKFFYTWRRIARERALDRRAREARDASKAYRAAKRAEQRQAAEQAAAEERERAIEARRMASSEAKLLEEMGYAEFAARRKTVAEPQESDPKAAPHKLPVRAIKDGIASTVSRAKDMLMRRKRTSMDGDSVFDDGGSISGESAHSVRSMQSTMSKMSRMSRMSRDSIGSNTNTNTVTYYRRSVPGKGRLHSIFTRVPSGSSTGTAEAAPKKMTNFMRYRAQTQTQRWGSPAASDRPSFSSSVGVGSGRPSFSSSVGVGSVNGRPSFSSSIGVSGNGFGSSVNSVNSTAPKIKTKSSYWRLRAMGMVQMPNKQYLHESLALPMLQDGKRFPGVGNYGLPPVPTPTWDAGDAGGDPSLNAEMVDVHDDGDGDAEDDKRTETYAEEILRRTMVPSASSSSLSRKRVFSSSTDGVHRAGMDAVSGYSAEAKKARVEAKNDNEDKGEPTEAERVIREMRELAAAMDEDRDWFKEQTELLKKGVSAWD